MNIPQCHDVNFTNLNLPLITLIGDKYALIFNDVGFVQDLNGYFLFQIGFALIRYLLSS